MRRRQETRARHGAGSLRFQLAPNSVSNQTAPPHMRHNIVRLETYSRCLYR